MCVQSIKVPKWKKSGNLFHEPCMSFAPNEQVFIFSGSCHFCPPELFLSTFASVSKSIYNKYCTYWQEIFNFLAICLWESPSLNKIVSLHPDLARLILPFCLNYFKIKKINFKRLWKYCHNGTIFFFNQRHLYNNNNNDNDNNNK